MEYCEEAGYFVIYTRFQYAAARALVEMKLPGVLQSHGIADCAILAGTNYENFTRSLEQGGVEYVLLANNFVGKGRRKPCDRAA